MNDDPTRPSVVSADRLAILYGRRQVLHSLSLETGPGDVYALLGRNGTGKSSLVRCLLGLQQPSGGTTRLFGQDSWQRRRHLMRWVGVVPEQPEVPSAMTPRQALRLVARLRGELDRQAAVDRLDRYEVQLDAPFGSLSRGQKTLVQLALALAARPRLLILDDPTLGLDAVARRALFHELIDELAERELTILLTSHDLDGVESLATHVGILHGGRLVVDESLESLKHRYRRVTLPTGSGPPDRGARADRRLAWGRELILDDFDAEAARELPSRATVEAMTLEQIFLSLTDPERDGSPQPPPPDESGSTSEEASRWTA